MRSDWPSVRLREITSEIGDGLHGTPTFDERGAFHFINGSNLAAGQIVVSPETRRVSKNESDKYRKPLSNRTLLVSINGTLGNVALYRGEKVVLGKSACYLNVQDGVNRDFVRYVLENESFQNHIRNLATGTTIKNVSLRLVRDFSFNLPPLGIQEKISAILGSLDERIGLLRQTNATLESIAQALFKSWFVDFDPVRAKAEGREPEGMDPTTAALFPVEFEESALGLIPKGWSVTSLGREAVSQIGGVWGEEHATEKATEQVCCLRGIDAVDLAAGNIPTPPTRWVSVKQLESRRLLEGDVLIEGSGSFCGRSLYWTQQYEGLMPWRPTYSNFVKRVSALRGPHVSRWVQRHLELLYQSGEVKNYRTGSAFPNLDLAGILSVERVLPHEGLLRCFNDLVATMEASKASRIRQIATLTMLRDTLLPRLISGTLRLTEVKAQVEEAIA
jgi:type I restriction enzyme S subunit